MNKLCNYCVNQPRQANYIVNGDGYVCKTCIESSILQRFWKTSDFKIEYIQNKQVNRYNLSLDHRYRIISFDYCGSILDGGGTTCDNCGRIIVNIATVETEQGKKYTVGLDCAETLSLVDCNDFWKIKEQEALHRKLTGYIKTIKKQQDQSVKVTYNIDQYGAYIYFWAMRQYRMSTEIYNKYFKSLNLPIYEK